MANGSQELPIEASIVDEAPIEASIADESPVDAVLYDAADESPSCGLATTSVGNSAKYNPWAAFRPEDGVLDMDRAAVDAWNARHPNDKYTLLTALLPGPWVGNVCAPIVLLCGNPGFAGTEFDVHAQPWFRETVLANLRQEDCEYPLYGLNPAHDTPGRKWNERVLKPILQRVPRRIVARNCCLIDYHPYHSKAFRDVRLPSQAYTFRLVRNAVARGALIVIMRCRKNWLNAVPELTRPDTLCSLNSAQNVMISPNNCPQFGLIIERLLAVK